MNKLINLQGMPTASDRLCYLRSLTRLSRAEIEKRYELSAATLKTWESGGTPLSKKGAERCTSIFRQEGIILGENWLLKGEGLDPQLTGTLGRYFSTTTTEELDYESNDELCMMRDANLFKTAYPNAIVHIVSNDEMRPFYKPGDYVGGRLREISRLESVVNKDCIIKLSSGDQFFRRLIKDSKGHYNLTCLNPTTTTAEPVIYHADIQSAAPVIWHRWQDD